MQFDFKLTNFGAQPCPPEPHMAPSLQMNGSDLHSCATLFALYADGAEVAEYFSPDQHVT